MAKKGIYKITNTRTGKAYIGQSVNMGNRWNQHQNELNRGTHHNEGLQRDWNRGDKFNFRVLEETPYLDEREKFYINYFDTFNNGYNGTRGGSGVNYSPTYYSSTYYQNDKTVENFFIACGVFLGVYLLTLFISSFIFRPLGNYNDMIISTIVALFVSIYVILRWKKGFTLGVSKFFVNKNKSSGATNYKTTVNNKISTNNISNVTTNKTVPTYNNSLIEPIDISQKSISQYKLKIQTMNNDSFEEVMNHFHVPKYQKKWDRIVFLFRNNANIKIIKKVNEILVAGIYENLSEEIKEDSKELTKRRILKIYTMDDESYRSLCNYFSAPKHLKKEKQIEFIFNNNSGSEIMEKAYEILGESVYQNSELINLKYDMA